MTRPVPHRSAPRPPVPAPTSARPRWRVVAGLLVVMALGAGSTAATSCRSPSTDGSAGHPVVVEVIDGDTLVARIDGREETVRLLGIDTPETVHPSRPPECFGAEASARLAELLPPGTPVRAERDVEGRDAYGRLLLHLHRADGLFVNHELVAAGFATTLVIPPNGAYASLLGQAERTARAEGRGLWGACGGASGSVPL
jgi:micrococcal nuclease